LFFNRSISLKQGLLLIVFAALLPITFTSVLQSVATWNAMQNSALTSLHANAKAVAERERDPFLISQRLLMVAEANFDIYNMTDRCADALASGFKGYKPIVNFIRADAAGRVRCSILPFREGTSFIGEQWWERTRKSGGITVNQPSIGRVSGVPVIIIALPIRDKNGAFAGTFSAGLDISQLAKSIANAPEAKTGVIAIVSGNKELVASSTPQLPFDLPATFTNIRSGTATGPKNEKWVFDSVPLSGPELYVLYAEPRSKIMSAAVEQFRASIILPIAAILLALLAIWFGTNRLAIRWLTSLRELSKEFTQGNYAGNRAAFANAPLELADLSNDLHDMAHVIQSRTKDLTDALDAKTELTREVHHRVKNNLQIVTSLLTMQASRMKDDTAQSALRQSRSRIVALALIHRLIYEQDADSERGEVAIENLMGELCKQLRSTNRDRRNIELECQTDSYSVPLDLAVPLALFTVEAVTNSYRHAFPSGAKGKIELSFRQVGKEAILTVADNGAGYKERSNTGAEMGSELMHAFATQLDGSVTFASKSGNGSSTRLTFPATAQITGRLQS
jgi:two-component sensor histidine kinase